MTKAKYRSDFMKGNAQATLNLLRSTTQLKQIKKFCYLSSLTAVGPSPDGTPLDELAPCHPITAYGKSKLEAETYCRQFMDKLPLVIVRPPAVFGPRDTDILEMFKWVSHGFKPIIGSSEKTLSLVYAPDLAKGIIRATTDDRTTGQIYNISDPTIFSFSSLIDYLSTLVHKRTRNIFMPGSVIYSMAGITQFISSFLRKPAVLNIEKARDLLQKHWVCDPRKIYEHLGFKTTTSVYDGLKNTFQWYKDVGWL